MPDQEEPHFVKADMVPISWEVACPSCGASIEVPEVEDDDAGIYRAANEHCCLECEGCGALVEPRGAIVTATDIPPYYVGGRS